MSGRHRVIATTVVLGGAFAPLRSGWAQEVAPGPSLSFEVLGNGLVYSANLEYPFGEGWHARLGVGGLWFEGVQYYLALFMVGRRFTGPRHQLRLGLGAGIIRFEDVFILEGRPETAFYGTATVAYRLQPHPHGIFFQVSFTPVLAESTLAPWPGLAVGWTF